MLGEHRRRHGFAPQVRIGLHAAEATVVGEDYAGIGDPIPFPVVREHAESLKGIANPVRVATVEWRPTAS